MFPYLVYASCALMSILCAVLLFRGYRISKARLLFWSCVCFSGLALNNILLFIDLAILPTSIDLSIERNAAALTAMGALLFGLIWDSH
jgi:hypothetical protein